MALLMIRGMVKSVNIGKSAAKYPLYISFKNNFELYLF